MTDEVATKRRTLIATPAELAAAREARGMSQVDISQRIKLQIRQVDALEQGRWEALPGRAFVRGALRSYGRLLDVDVSPLLEAIGGFAEPAPVHALQPLDATLSRSAGINGGVRGSPLVWVVACLVGVVALVLYFGSDPDGERVRSWLPAGGVSSGDAPGGVSAAAGSAGSRSGSADALSSGSAPGGASASGAAGGGASAPGAASPAPSILSALQVLTPRASPPGAGEGASGSSAAAPPGGGPTAASPAPPATSPSASGTAATTGLGGAAGAAPGTAAGTDGTARPGSGIGTTAPAETPKLMQLRARDDSWVEVRLADGSALHNALLKAGTSIELKGTPPLRVVIGNASRFELTYEGKPQDLAPHIRANNIARLQLQ